MGRRISNEGVLKCLPGLVNLFKSREGKISKNVFSDKGYGYFVDVSIDFGCPFVIKYRTRVDSKSEVEDCVSLFLDELRSKIPGYHIALENNIVKLTH